MNPFMREPVFHQKVSGKTTLTPDTCNMEPETIITDLAHGVRVPWVGHLNP